MAAGFRTRRIRTERSIGDQLKKARTRKKISISQVEEATKIRARFILALESDSWEQIPSEVYGRGYLETYLQFLQIPAEPVMKQYFRERDMYARHCQDGAVELAPKNKLTLPRFILTPRFFAILVGVMVLVGFGGVIGKQVYTFGSAPYLRVAVAKADEAASTVSIQGCTAVGAQVEVNGQPAQVGQDGCFNQPMRATKGYNTYEVKAWNGQKETAQIVSSDIK
ncbi:helix-turn-helix domain-containing protein [Patescibacteria group bacterium]|nr:helix-turn-helix domain-containing protein [Patescibacteria group bacterium]